MRREGRATLHPHALVADLGSGNGRNLIWLAREFGCRGVGYDAAAEAVAQAKSAGQGLPLEFAMRRLDEPLPLADHSVTLALDMMSSHVLRQLERERLRGEISRVLKPGGWFFFKTFLAEGDLHLERLVREHPGGEPNSYLHPAFHHFEHAWTIDEIEDWFLPEFELHKIEKSHKHLKGRNRPGGPQAFRRRTVSVYLQKR